MVQEIKKAFRAKYNKINLSNERLEAYASKWASKIEDENAIEEFLNGLDVEPLEEIARLDDALRAKQKQEEPKPKDDEPKPQPPTGDYVTVEQFNELKELLNAKTKSDLVNSRTEQLKNIPEELRVALKYTQLDALTDEQFSELKNDLNSQAEKLKLAQSQTNPLFSNKKPATELSADEKRYLESKRKKS